jgi:hypothetical protein
VAKLRRGHEFAKARCVPLGRPIGRPPRFTD